MGKYKRAFLPSRGESRDSVWKRTKWDRWGFWRKARHVIAVIVCVITVLAMWLGTMYIALIYFGVLGYLQHFRDTVLLEFVQWLSRY